MEAVRRVALIVRPKQPYVDWANSVDGSASPLALKEARAHPSIYLVNAEPEEVLQIERYVEEIFEAELEAWTDDETRWPPDRTSLLFYLWFDVITANQLWDLDEQDSMFDDELPGECAWCRKSLGDGDSVVTVTIVRSPDIPVLQSGPVELPIGGRVLSAMVPVRDSESGRLGAGALILLCSDDCASLVRRALGQHRHACNS
jgi:hypothetical protein